MARLMLSEVSGILKDLFDKMSGEDGSIWAEDLKCLLRGEMTRGFKLWRAITLGLHKSSSAYCRALESAGHYISYDASQIFHRAAVSKIMTDVELVMVTGSALGFVQAVRRNTIYARAQEMGLGICPAEVGPAICLAYQPISDWFLIAMEPIADADGNLRIFRMERQPANDKWLLSSLCVSVNDDLWSSQLHWVFLRKK